MRHLSALRDALRGTANLSLIFAFGQGYYNLYKKQDPIGTADPTGGQLAGIVVITGAAGGVGCALTALTALLHTRVHALHLIDRDGDRIG